MYSTRLTIGPMEFEPKDVCLPPGKSGEESVGGSGTFNRWNRSARREHAAVV